MGPSSVQVFCLPSVGDNPCCAEQPLRAAAQQPQLQCSLDLTSCQLPLQVAELFFDAAEALEAKQAGAVRQGAPAGEVQLWAAVQADGHSQSVASGRPGYTEQYPILSSILTVDLAVARDAKTAKASCLQLPCGSCCQKGCASLHERPGHVSRCETYQGMSLMSDQEWQLLQRNGILCVSCCAAQTYMLVSTCVDDVQMLHMRRQLASGQLVAAYAYWHMSAAQQRCGQGWHFGSVGCCSCDV